MLKTMATVVSLLLAAAMSPCASAQEKKLKVGDQAPGLDIELWVSGNETTIQSGEAYIVMFFRTDSGPAKRGMTVINDAYKDYHDAGLSVIGISWEEPDVVKRFVNGMRETLSITIAADRRDGTKRAWMDAAGVDYEPVLFIVDRKGKIAWIGNPATPDAAIEFIVILARVLDGRFDPRLERQATPAIQGAASARKVKNWRMANKYYDDVVTLDAGIFANVALDKFEMLLVDMNDPKQAYEYANTLITEKFASDSGALMMLADKIALDPKIIKENRDLDVALLAAEASKTLVGESNPKTLAGVARIRHARGETAQAIELQKKAYFNAAPKVKSIYKRQLELYQQQADREANMSKTPKPAANPSATTPPAAPATTPK